MNTQEKLRKLLLAKQNPSLALFELLNEAEKKFDSLIESKIEELVVRIQYTMEQKIASIPQPTNLFENIKELKGEQGIQGKDGTDGYTPIKGVDYFDGTDGIEGKRGKKGRDGKDGKDGRDGKDGISVTGPAGKDGSPDTPKQVRQKLEALQGEDRLDAKAIKNLPKFEGKTRHLPRGAVTLQTTTPSGTIDGNNKVFTLGIAYNYGMLFLNGAFQTPGGTDYTISGSTITYVVAPLTNSIHTFLYG